MIFTEEDRLRELRLAQKEIYNAGNDLVSAGLRLQGTKYEKSYERLYKALNALNLRLISEINKKQEEEMIWTKNIAERLLVISSASSEPILLL